MPQADHRTGKERALSLKGTFDFSSVLGRREVCDSQLITYLPLGTKGYLPDSGSDSAFRGPSSRYSFHLSIQQRIVEFLPCARLCARCEKTTQTCSHGTNNRGGVSRKTWKARPFSAAWSCRNEKVCLKGMPRRACHGPDSSVQT